ncbi:MAG: hypothetical protein CMA27_05495 [Euryarchaeota archaeon]|nr:hypothetical protein [Euryarchaeota archaeon]|tara:strand:- start:16036 stop:16725 length:690 start_codon:yes stop_codon:yes gene_type:complete
MLTVLVPSYNEENIIQKSIDSILSWSKNNNIEIELIVINNNSYDDTEKICKENLDRLDQEKNFRYINEPKKGKGFAVKAGLSNASSNKILILDADLSVGIDQFDINWLNIENISISGNRFAGEVIGTPLRRNFTGKIFSFIVRTLFKIPIEDTQCGFKYISYNNISKLNNILSVGNFAYDVDLLLALNSLKITLEEVPVIYIHNNETSVNIFTDSISMFFSLLLLKKKY